MSSTVKPPAQSSRPPPHWPDNIQYITAPKYHTSVPRHIRDIICPSAVGQPKGQIQQAQKAAITIQLISDPSHPARGQYGLFAAKKIPPRTLILDYIGEIHCDDRPASDYDLSLYRTSDGVNVGVDAQHTGNEARFVNDYRGVKQRPNVFFQDRRTETGELRICIWSGSESIRKGDELLVSYGKSWWAARQADRDSVREL